MNTLRQIKTNFMHKETARFVQEYQLLMTGIMKQIKWQLNGWGNRRVEGDGVHFIHSGQALVLDHQRIWVHLSKCDCFGLSPMVKEIVSCTLIVNDYS